MLAERIKQWPEQWKAEGLREGEAKGLREGKAKGLREGEAKGLREGKAKGLREGMERALILQLEQKFGRLSPTQATRLKNASEDRLLIWLQRLLSADSVDQVLAD